MYPNSTSAFLIAALLCAAPAFASLAPSIIPLPAKLEIRAGTFELGVESSVSASAAAAPAADYFVELMQRTRGIALQRVNLSKSEAAEVVFDTDLRPLALPLPSPGALAPADERYRIEISAQRARVSARDQAGLFYGAVTLWQLLTSTASAQERASTPAVYLIDGPRFAWRGLMLDSARHYQSPAFIKRFIDSMALHKLNVLHWHLVDDQGWRLEIKKYPQLTAVGAWRVPAGTAALADVDPKTGKPRVYGGFYTQDEVRDIVAYARSRHITIVPEIEMPGHATAAVVAYPMLASTSSPPTAMPADWGIYPNLFNVEDSTFAFLEDVLKEVLALFPSTYIHVGGDEAVKDQWLASTQVQARMRALGIADEHALQSYFIQRIEKFLNANGRRLIGWDEILEGGIAPNATVMSWRGIEGAVAAAAAGHDAVLSPAPTLYFDNRQSAFDTQPGRGAIIGVEQVYRFDPLPVEIKPEHHKHVLGLQGNLWTEHMRSDQRVEYMTFPRAAAVSEIAWSPASRLSFEDFRRRLEMQYDRYASLEVGYAPPASASPLSDTTRMSHELALCSDKLVLSLEDDAPVHGERATFLVDVMQPCWMFLAVDLAQLDGIQVDVGQVPFNFQIGKDRDAIVFQTPRTPSGELEVRAGCGGPLLTSIELAPAKDREGVTSLPRAKLSGAGVQDLCFTFAQRTLDPLWVIHRVRLVRATSAGS
jgi:hexosaminidase